MVSCEFIEDRLTKIRTSSARLKEMQNLSKKQFLANPDHYADQNLRVVVEGPGRIDS